MTDATHAVIAALLRALHDAERFDGADRRDAALEAGAWALVAAAADRLGSVPDAASRAVRDVVPGAVSQARAEALRAPDRRGELLDCAGLAELGLRALDAEPDWASAPQDLTLPSPKRLRRALGGQIDGFRAARAVARARAAGEPLGALSLGPASEPRWRLAAADDAPMRDPSGGRTLEPIEGLDVDRVWFEAERELAVYARSAVAVLASGDGVETLDVKPGYWLGRLADPGAEVVLRVGETERATTLG